MPVISVQLVMKKFENLRRILAVSDAKDGFIFSVAQVGDYNYRRKISFISAISFYGLVSKLAK